MVIFRDIPLSLKQQQYYSPSPQSTGQTFIIKTGPGKTDISFFFWGGGLNVATALRNRDFTIEIILNRKSIAA